MSYLRLPCVFTHFPCLLMLMLERNNISNNVSMFDDAKHVVLFSLSRCKFFHVWLLSVLLEQRKITMIKWWSMQNIFQLSFVVFFLLIDNSFCWFFSFLSCIFSPYPVNSHYFSSDLQNITTTHTHTNLFAFYFTSIFRLCYRSTWMANCVFCCKQQ